MSKLQDKNKESLTFTKHTFDLSMLGDLPGQHCDDNVSIIKSVNDLLEAAQRFHQLDVQPDYEIVAGTFK